MFVLGGILTSFDSLTQKSTAAQSTVEAELIAASYESKNTGDVLSPVKSVYVSDVLKELPFRGRFGSSPPRGDSTGALHLMSNGTYNTRMKHITLCFFLPEGAVGEQQGRDRFRRDGLHAGWTFAVYTWPKKSLPKP